MEKRRTPAKDFQEYLLVLSPLKSFVQVLNGQVFVLMQKTDCLSRKASLTFSVSLLAKFCAFQNLRNDSPGAHPEDDSLKIYFTRVQFLFPNLHREFFIYYRSSRK